MIDRDPPYYFDVACDGCPDGYERIEAMSFRKVVLDIKELGWSIRKNQQDEWVHFCPDCSEERGYASVV